MLVDKKTFARLPAPLQETLRQVTAKHLARVIERTRKDNDDALQVILKRGVRMVTPKPAEVEHFMTFSEGAMKDLGPEFLPRDTMKKVNTWLAEYRTLHPEKP
jgi:TRAP-type C4-dicarboxylate transport system substrate-binding protein